MPNSRCCCHCAASLALARPRARALLSSQSFHHCPNKIFITVFHFYQCSRILRARNQRLCAHQDVDCSWQTRCETEAKFSELFFCFLFFSVCKNTKWNNGIVSLCMRLCFVWCDESALCEGERASRRDGGERGKRSGLSNNGRSASQRPAGGRPSGGRRASMGLVEQCMRRAVDEEGERG